MESIQVKARYYNAQLDKELSKIPQLNQFQTQTGVPKTYLAIGSGSLIALLIFFNFAGKFLSNTIGFGASVVYTRILRPFLTQHSSRIDHSLNNIKTKVSAVAADIDASTSH
ncbi:ER membrane protein DP1/Yop1 [Podila horticola]|nr:ER membrane protein DP1/Yop1 [Podila horticola]